ncbi:methionine--tRNA ligase [Patescibacteria group bacterium]|nr:methionine--tRNA ligase [Patescibacteria group bacterium]
MKKLITTPIYYVNDIAHLGHAYTTLAADVLTRFFREQGEQVFFLTGTDEHGAKIAESAKKEGKDPKEFCDEKSELFKKTWENLNIKYDHFVRTTDEKHEKAVKKFLENLKDSIYEKEYEGLYCTGCEKFLTEKELVDGLCPDHKKEPEKIKEKNYFFKLKDYLNKVEKLIESGKLKIEPDFARKETLALLKQDLDDFSISRQKVKWGIEFPFDKNQTIYVWFEALLNYVSSIGYGTDEFNEWWDDAEIVHLLAKDILKFHTIYWPAILLAAKQKTPDKEFIHGFFTVDGQKMSKTIGNVIDPNDIVNEFGVDGARYLLLSQFPFGQDGDFKKEKFIEKYNSDLANGLGNLVARVLKLATDKKLEPEKNILDRTKQTRDNYLEYFKDFKLFEVLNEIWKLIAFCNEYIDKNKPWESENREQIISNLLYAISEIAFLIEPFLPETSEKIKKQLENNKSIILFKRMLSIT